MKHEVQSMTNLQYKGNIKLIIKLLKTKTPRKKIIKYLKRLIE